MEEGRNVAAALVSLEPMSRLDASLFTDEALDNLVTTRDVVNSKALALDYLPEDKVLLTDGTLHHTSSNAQPSALHQSPPSPPLPTNPRVCGGGGSAHCWIWGTWGCEPSPLTRAGR